MFPENDPSFELNVIPEMDDFIIHLSDENCKRFDDVQSSVKGDMTTLSAMQVVANDMELSGFFPELRKMTNQTNATTDEMYDSVNYIYWANQSDMQLSFELD